MEEGQAAGDRAFVWVDEAFRLPETNTKTCCKSQPEPGLSIYERYTNTSLFKALYPLFFSMKLTGLYFVRNYPEPGCRPRGILPTPSQLFATGCLIIHWLNVIRSLFSFNSEDQFGSELFMKVVFTSFGILASLNVTTLYIACHRSDWLPELFLYWDGLRSLSNQSCVQYVRKRVLGLCVFSWVIIFSSISCNAYIAVSRNMFDMRFLPFTLDMPHFQVVKLVFIIVDLLLNSAWLFPVILTCGTCVVLFKEFSMVNTKLLTILGDLDILAVDMPSIRLRHQNVCKLVEKADKFLCLHMAASFVHNILTICLMLYVLAFDQRFNLDPVVLGISVAWTLTAIVYLGVGCVGGAMVNSQAHAAFSDFHDIDMTSATPDIVLQVHLFLSRLSGAPIGLTALNMFVIDKPTILTLIGVLITYFVVLLQFNTAGMTSSHDCAETCAVITNTTLGLLTESAFTASN